MTTPRKLKDGGNQERQDRAQELLSVARNFKPGTNIRYRQRAQAELLEMLRPLIFKLIQNTNWLQYVCEDDLAQHARQVITAFSPKKSFRQVRRSQRKQG